MNDESIIFRELPVGITLAQGKYLIEKVLGVGGFGITYKARHATLNQDYAIKEFFISGHCIRSTQHKTVHLHGMQEDMYGKYKQKFVEEAQVLAKLDHPNVVKVLDIFEENGTFYIVMPFVHGETLHSIVAKEGKLPYEIGVNYIAQVCEALDYIHGRNLLHRDIKPDNIMITPEDKAVLIDFGSAREFVHDEMQSHTTILTQGYAPLEQYSKLSRKGAYTDIYGLGAVFYFLVTGQKPMEATDRIDHELVNPTTFVPDLPENVSKTILKAMALKPENRHQNVDEFMCELTGLKDWRRPVIVEKSGISKKWIIVIIIGVIALLAGGGLWYLQHEKDVQEQIRLEQEQNRLEEQKRYLLNGKVEQLQVWIYENAAYLRPTTGDLNKTVYYTAPNGSQMETVQNLPTQSFVCSYTYTGQMQNGFPNGAGFAIYDNKATYEGPFSKGLKHGNNAKYVEPDGVTIFEGGYKNDLRNGKGKLTRPDGTIFDGIWRDGAIYGNGQILDADGKVLESGFYTD